MPILEIREAALPHVASRRFRCLSRHAVEQENCRIRGLVLFQRERLRNTAWTLLENRIDRFDRKLPFSYAVVQAATAGSVVSR